MGWMLASIVLLQNAVTGLTAPVGTDPLDGHVLQHSDGNVYVYHDGLKFAVQVANVGDAVINVIPQASPGRWVELFNGSAPNTPVRVPQPEICYWCAS